MTNWIIKGKNLKEFPGDFQFWTGIDWQPQRKAAHKFLDIHQACRTLYQLENQFPDYYTEPDTE